MRAGKLDREVHLLRRGAPVDDGYGSQPGDWALLGARAASVQPVRRGEQFENDGRLARREMSLWLRWDALTATLSAQDSAVLDGLLYELTAQPVMIGRREGVELLAVAADPAVAVDVAALDAWVAA